MTGHGQGRTAGAGPSRKVKARSPATGKKAAAITQAKAKAQKPWTAAQKASFSAWMKSHPVKKRGPGKAPHKPKAQHHAHQRNQAAVHAHTNHAVSHACHCGKPHPATTRKPVRKPRTPRKAGAAMRAR
jgi:hypothetical protein